MASQSPSRTRLRFSAQRRSLSSWFCSVGPGGTHRWAGYTFLLESLSCLSCSAWRERPQAVAQTGGMLNALPVETPPRLRADLTLGLWPCRGVRPSASTEAEAEHTRASRLQQWHWLCPADAVAVPLGRDWLSGHLTNPVLPSSVVL